jgi:6-phosphofructokinase 2
MAQDILTVTLNPALDLATATEKLTAGPKLRCSAPRFDPGGGGLNVSRVIAELGGHSKAWTVLGGSLGSMCQDLLRSEDIAFTFMEGPGMTRLSVSVTEEVSGDQYRFVLPGPEFGAADGERALESIERALSGPGLVVVSGSMPPGLPASFMGRLAGRVSAAGARLILDSSGAPLQAALDEGVFLVKPNLREAQILAGRDLPDTEARLVFAGELIDRGAAEVVVISLGGEGALVVGKDLRLLLRVPPVEVKSAVGAGDSTVGGLTLGLARGATLEEAARLGLAAGTAAVSTVATALCQREDVQRLLDQIRVERL